MSADETKPWIRGVNIGGWLLLERFITPYLFSITDCHTTGDFCWYPGQIDAPPPLDPAHKLCDYSKCKPYLKESVTGEMDFPVDEWTLSESFKDKDTARAYLKYHWEHFVTRDDLVKLKEAGVTHVRVPIPHWIMGDIAPDEPYVDGGWLYFTRFIGWCRALGIKVWPDIHTAPGSQNGFDNSGHLLPGEPTCLNWSSSQVNVERSLRAVRDVVTAIKDDGLDDVVTGFGVLNEPFKDCDPAVARSFNNQAFSIVRETLGQDTAIYIGDLFNATKFNDGWWTDEKEFSNTFLDSHYYHVFAEEPRALSPKQHIAYVCAKNYRDTISCCYEDHPEKNTIPSKGISRLIGEWSAAFDTLPVAKLADVMAGIAKTGVAPEFDREISMERRAFLKNYVEAQMVAYEAASVGVSRGWFYWTYKMEGGAFAEWDFLRGTREGWIPPIPKPSVESREIYGTCYDIISKTRDDMSIVHEFPDPSTLPENNWQGVAIDDDLVVTHGGTYRHEGNEPADNSSPIPPDDPTTPKTVTTSTTPPNDGNAVAGKTTKGYHVGLFPIIVVGFFVYGVWRVFFRREATVRDRHQYQTVGSYQQGLTV